MAEVSERIREHFKSAFGLSDAAAQGLLGTSRAALRAGLAALGEAIGNGDSEGVSHWAHSIKGNLLNSGLPELAEIALSMEVSATRGRACERELRGAHGRLEASLASFLRAD